MGLVGEGVTHSISNGTRRTLRIDIINSDFGLNRYGKRQKTYIQTNIYFFYHSSYPCNSIREIKKSYINDDCPVFNFTILYV